MDLRGLLVFCFGLTRLAAAAGGVGLDAADLDGAGRPRVTSREEYLIMTAASAGPSKFRRLRLSQAVADHTLGGARHRSLLDDEDDAAWRLRRDSPGDRRLAMTDTLPRNESIQAGNLQVGFPLILGQTCPQDPPRSPRLALQFSLHEQSAPQNNSKAMS